LAPITTMKSEKYKHLIGQAFYLKTYTSFGNGSYYLFPAVVVVGIKSQASFGVKALVVPAEGDRRRPTPVLVKKLLTNLPDVV